MAEVSVLLLKSGRHVDKLRVMNLVQQLVPAFPPIRHADAFNSVATRDAYIYLTIDPVTGGNVGMARAHAHLSHVDPAMHLVDLQMLRALPGLSAGRKARYLYVVESDVVAVAEKEANDWFEGEHLPRLAAVPGLVHARRLRSPEGSPRYHSCYEVESPQTVESDAWKAVRNTPWSGLVRPTFINQRKTLFERVCALIF